MPFVVLVLRRLRRIDSGSFVSVISMAGPERSPALVLRRRDWGGMEDILNCNKVDVLADVHSWLLLGKGYM